MENAFHAAASLYGEFWSLLEAGSERGLGRLGVWVRNKERGASPGAELEEKEGWVVWHNSLILLKSYVGGSS